MDRFDLWTYKNDANCWDFVREYLIERFNVPAKDVPKYGILPTDKARMTEASKDVLVKFYESEPIDGAIACQYINNTLHHVGVVDGGLVKNVGKKTGVRRDKIKQFSRFRVTKYYLHKSLWPN